MGECKHTETAERAFAGSDRAGNPKAQRDTICVKCGKRGVKASDSRFVLEEKNAQLEEKNAELEEENATLEEKNAELEEKIATLEAAPTEDNPS